MLHIQPALELAIETCRTMHTQKKNSKHIACTRTSRHMNNTHSHTHTDSSGKKMQIV